MQSLLTIPKYDTIWKQSGGSSDSLSRGQHFRQMRLPGALYIRSQARAIRRHNRASYTACLYSPRVFEVLSRDFRSVLVPYVPVQ